MSEIRIVVKNQSPLSGTFLTPVWFGFHDGSFDLYDRGTPASAGLEQLAEDGDVAGLAAELLLADVDGQGAVVTGARGPVAAQETGSLTLFVDGASNGYVSLASMIIPSNDAFIGNGSAIRLFDSHGRFEGETNLVFLGSDVLDAGTEINTERDAAFINQTAPNTGVDQNGTVESHPGFNGSLGNPVGEGAQIILGGTNAFGEFIDPIAADFTRPGAEIAEVHFNTVLRREGSDGRDVIKGRADDDIVSAGDGKDTVLGNRGWDEIFGEAGDDLLFGGKGSDSLLGGTGDDRLRGGSEDDTFVFGTGDEDDVIGDFTVGVDQILLSVEGFGDFATVIAAAWEDRRGTVLEFGTDSILLRGVSRAELSEGDFLFA